MMRCGIRVALNSSGDMLGLMNSHGGSEQRQQVARFERGAGISPKRSGAHPREKLSIWHAQWGC